MNDKVVNPEGKKSLKEEEGKRKPYQPPAWEVEEVFEKTALQTTCAKADDVICAGGIIQS